MPPVVQTTSSEVSSTIDQQCVREPAGQGAQLLPPAHARLQRRRRAGPAPNAVNVGGGEVWNFGTYVDGTNNHSKWLTLQRAPQLGSSGFALETVKEVQLITNQFSAEFGGHSAGVASMITKSGTNERRRLGRSCMLRPGRLRRPAAAGAASKAPYNQQQFGGTIGGPLVKDKLFYFGSYERRRERSQVVVTSPVASGPVGADAGRRAPGPLAKCDYPLLRRRTRSACATTWCAGRRTTRAAACSLPGTGFIWDNNVDTVHGTFTTVARQRFLNEVRGQYSRYTDRRAAKCDCVSAFNRANYAIERRQRPRHVGRAARDDLRPVRHGVAVDGQAHHQDRRVVHLRRHQAAVSSRCRTASTASPAARRVAPTPFQFQQSFALVPEARADVPEGLRAQRLPPGRLARPRQPDAQPRPALRRRDHQGHPRLAGRHRQATTSIRASASPGIRRATRSGRSAAASAASRSSTPIFTIVKGGVGGRNGQVTLSLAPTDALFPTFPNVLPAFPPGAVLPPRDIQEISPDLENEHAWAGNIGFQRQLGPRTSVAGRRQHQPRRQKHGFLDMNQARADPTRTSLNAALAAESANRDVPHRRRRPTRRGRSRRCRTASAGWTC